MLVLSVWWASKISATRNCFKSVHNTASEIQAFMWKTTHKPKRQCYQTINKVTPVTRHRNITSIWELLEKEKNRLPSYTHTHLNTSLRLRETNEKSKRPNVTYVCGGVLRSLEKQVCACVRARFQSNATKKIVWFRSICASVNIKRLEQGYRVTIWFFRNLS